MQFSIMNRWTNEVQFTADIECAEDTPNSLKIGLALKWGVANSANLRGADLSGSDLRDSDLRDSNLSGADLRGSDLSDSDLSGANLSGSDLRDSNLRGADLSGSNLIDSNLDPIRNDIWSILVMAPGEVPALIAALNEGRVNGSVYTDGECGCLIGTLAIASGVNPAGDCSSVNGLHGHSSRPAECFFMGINKGDTPETNQICRIARDWCVQWLDRMEAAFGASNKEVPA